MKNERRHPKYRKSESAYANEDNPSLSSTPICSIWTSCRRPWTALLILSFFFRIVHVQEEAKSRQYQSVMAKILYSTYMTQKQAIPKITCISPSKLPMQAKRLFALQQPISTALEGSINMLPIAHTPDSDPSRM